MITIIITRNDKNQMETRVYRKETSTNICINWNAHAPSNWKIGRLRNLLKRAKIVSYLLKPY